MGKVVEKPPSATWFAGHGKIFNIGVYPYAEVQIAVYADSDQEARIIINAENYGDRYAVHPARTPSPDTHWDKHPLLEAAIEYMRIPENYSFEVTIYSEAPTGASTGTSAAVTVALIEKLTLTLLPCCCTEVEFTSKE